jgi:DNA-binding MurR/RpiR family transcriptional regulator
MSTFEERIRKAREDLSPSFGTLAEFLLDSYVEASFLTATELAHTLDIDPATVVRFAQRVGYEGYPVLQREIRDRVKQELLTPPSLDLRTPANVADSALAQVVHALERTRRSFPFETVDAIISALDEAERVIIFAQGLAHSPARNFGYSLSAGGYTIQFAGESLPEMSRAIVGARRRDLAMAFEVVDETPLVARALALASKAGLPTIALVAAASLQVTDYADLVLAGYGTTEPGIGQIILEAQIHALLKVLAQVRPGRFRDLHEDVRDMSAKMTHLPSE